jgi:hypothetical protein
MEFIVTIRSASCTVILNLHIDGINVILNPHIDGKCYHRHGEGNATTGMGREMLPQAWGGKWELSTLATLYCNVKTVLL